MKARARIAAAAGLALALGGAPAWSQGAPDGTPPAAEHEMKAFQIVFLFEEWVENPTAEYQLRRMGHAHEHFRKTMITSGATLIGGPVHDAEELREVAVLAVESPQQAREIYERSPAAHIGQQKVRAYTWWAADGILREPPDPTRRIDCYLGLLKRRYPIRHFSDEELQQIQQGHLANLEKMAAAGDLVIAGPVEDEEEEELRGILIFRTRDPERIRKLVAEDPAIQRGRLTLELHRWSVADGTFPPVP